MILFNDPVHAENAGIIHTGITPFSTINVSTGFIWEIGIFAGFYGTGTGNHAKSDITREPFGRERDITISPGTAWMGSRSHYL